MAGHVAAFNLPGYEGAYRRLSSASVNAQDWAGAHRAMARSFRQPERLALLSITASAGDAQPRPRGAAPGLQKARAAITDSLSLLRSGEEQENLVGVYDEMLVDKSGRMAKVRRPNRTATVLTRRAFVRHDQHARATTSHCVSPPPLQFGLSRLGRACRIIYLTLRSSIS